MLSKKNQYSKNQNQINEVNYIFSVTFGIRRVAAIELVFVFQSIAYAVSACAQQQNAVDVDVGVANKLDFEVHIRTSRRSFERTTSNEGAFNID